MRIALIMGAEKITNASGRFFASVLGVISPNIRRSTVITTVDTVVPMLSSLQMFMKSIVASDVLRMLTRLLPMSIVEIRVSKLSDSASTFAAFLLPFSAIFFNLIRLKVEKAVSVAEKYEEKTIQKIMITICKAGPMIFRLKILSS